MLPSANDFLPRAHQQYLVITSNARSNRSRWGCLRWRVATTVACAPAAVNFVGVLQRSYASNQIALRPIFPSRAQAASTHDNRTAPDAQILPMTSPCLLFPKPANSLAFVACETIDVAEIDVQQTEKIVSVQEVKQELCGETRVGRSSTPACGMQATHCASLEDCDLDQFVYHGSSVMSIVPSRFWCSPTECRHVATWQIDHFLRVLPFRAGSELSCVPLTT